MVTVRDFVKKKGVRRKMVFTVVKAAADKSQRPTEWPLLTLNQQEVCL